jgi:hypothetical protein
VKFLTLPDGEEVTQFVILYTKKGSADIGHQSLNLTCVEEEPLSPCLLYTKEESAGAG